MPKAGDHQVDLGPTGRELEVLSCYAAGKTRAQIALELKITPNTIRIHMATVERKLGAVSIAHAVAIAIKRGLIVV